MRVEAEEGEAQARYRPLLVPVGDRGPPLQDDGDEDGQRRGHRDPRPPRPAAGGDPGHRRVADGPGEDEREGVERLGQLGREWLGRRAFRVWTRSAKTSGPASAVAHHRGGRRPAASIALSGTGTSSIRNRWMMAMPSACHQITPSTAPTTVPIRAPRPATAQDVIVLICE
nr:hypothetical protein GCM10020093_054120 [Planobispora longispora]